MPGECVCVYNLSLTPVLHTNPSQVHVAYCEIGLVGNLYVANSVCVCVCVCVYDLSLTLVLHTAPQQMCVAHEIVWPCFELPCG